MNNLFLRQLQISLAILDLLTINIAFFATQAILKQHIPSTAHLEYTNFCFYINLSWLSIAALGNVYHKKYILLFEDFARRSMHAYVYFLAMVIIYLFFSQQYILSRIFIIVILCSIAFMLFINRFLYIVIYNFLRKRHYLINKVVVIGYNNVAKKLVSYLEENGTNKEVVGYCEEYQNIKELSHYPILSNIDGALNVCKQYGATEIYSTIAPEQNPNIYEIINMADQNCIRFKLVPDIGSYIKRNVHVDYLNEMPVLSLRKEPLEDISNQIKKRLFDIVISSITVVFILSWLMPLISLLIWLDSKGPIFFVQTRTGKGNKDFRCLKFRSMHINQMANEQQATKNDDRVTKLGRFLRHTNLDEFPQFINVLKGEMSIVGPRPHMLKHTSNYAQVVGQYMVRQFLKPGITGWAQVNGLRGEVKTMEQIQKRVEHDIWYLENWSLWLDLKIVFITIYNMIRGEEMAF